MDKIPVEKKSSPTKWVAWVLLGLGILALVLWLSSSRDAGEAEYVVNENDTIVAEPQDTSETSEPVAPR